MKKLLIQAKKLLLFWLFASFFAVGFLLSWLEILTGHHWFIPAKALLVMWGAGFVLALAGGMWFAHKKDIHDSNTGTSIMLFFGTWAFMMLVSFMNMLIAITLSKDESIAIFTFRLSLFLFTFILLWVYRRPDQRQYLLFALAYLLSVALGWLPESEMLLQWLADLLFEGQTSMARTLIVDFWGPFKEAILLYIIFDVYLIARKSCCAPGHGPVES